MKQVTVKLRDNTEIQIDKQYIWSPNIVDELNDIRTEFICIEDYIFAKDTIASVAIIEIEDSKEEQ